MAHDETMKVVVDVDGNGVGDGGRNQTFSDGLVMLSWLMMRL